MISSIDLVTDSIRNDPQVRAACYAIDQELQEIYNELPSILFWPFVDQQVPPLLDMLAWEMHVDVWQGWEGDLDIATKRKLIDESIDWHQHKGTKWAVEYMCKTLFTNAYVTEWYQYGGNPFFFKIVLNQQLTEEALSTLITSVYAVKNARSWLENVEITTRINQQLYVYIIVRTRVTIRIPVATNSRTPPPPPQVQPI